tara:strand:- start:1705 stop:2283 length:579 start_codon:yes stop_codon:yes gene_type:complete
MDKVYLLPNRPKEQNNIRRIISFDTAISGGHMYFWLAHQEDDLAKNKHKLYLYPRDVWMDKNLPWGSKAEKVMSTQIEVSVKKGLYLEADDWSQSHRWGIIFPPTANRLPSFIKNASTDVEKLFSNFMVGLVRTLSTTGAIIHTLEETNLAKDEFLERVGSGKQIEQTGEIFDAVKKLVEKEKESSGERPTQ